MQKAKVVWLLVGGGSAALVLSGVAWPLGTGLTVARAAVAATPQAPSTSPPEPVGLTAQMARYAAALVEGTVDGVSLSYDERRGPRTNFHMSVSKVHAGKLPSKDFVISQYGGSTPDGSTFRAPEVPMLAEGRSYLVMVANDKATGFWSGILIDYVFAIEDIGSSQVLVGPGGHVLRDVSVVGPRYGDVSLFEAPKYDGKKFSRPARLPSISAADVAAEVAEGLDVPRAVRSIVGAAAAEGVQMGGALASSDPPGERWDVMPAAQAQ